MPTGLDNLIRDKSKGAIWAFGLMVIVATALSFKESSTFPPEKDPTGDPTTWTREEMRRWLAARNLFPNESDTREELLERIKLNMRTPRQ